MNADDAETALAEIDLVPCMQGPLNDIKELRDACLSAEIPVVMGRDEGCCGKGGGGCGCAPKLQLLAREEDVALVARLVQGRWRQMAWNEGTVDADHPAVAAPAEGDDLPCPACGTAAPLAAGACSDCGLQLE
jgi:hypothetical protein